MMYHMKGKGKGKGKEREGRDVPLVTRFDGTDTRCSICQDNFRHDDMACCLRCDHAFHELCWDSMVFHDDGTGTRDRNSECPNCRRPRIAKACFRFIGDEAAPRESARETMNALRARNWGTRAARLEARRQGHIGRPDFIPRETSSDGSFVDVPEQQAEQHMFMMNEFTAAQKNAWYNSWSVLSPED